MEKHNQYDGEIENAYRDGTESPTADQETISSFSPADTKRVMRKVDLRLVPLCGVMYCVSLLDRTNLSNAAIAGMNEELSLQTGARYVSRGSRQAEASRTHMLTIIRVQSLVSLIFFISYTAMQPPATLLTRKIGPRIFLSSITFLWGIVMLGMGFIESWTSLLALRFVIGIFEAG